MKKKTQSKNEKKALKVKSSTVRSLSEKKMEDVSGGTIAYTVNTGRCQYCAASTSS